MVMFHANRISWNHPRGLVLNSDLKRIMSHLINLEKTMTKQQKLHGLIMQTSKATNIDESLDIYKNEWIEIATTIQQLLDPETLEEKTE